jgi:hypothetical protein
MTLNKIYQWTWFKLIMKLTPTISGKMGPERSHKRNLRQLSMSKLFGGPDAVILGDSEIAMFNTYTTMKQFGNVVLNMGEGGTTPADWIKYFLGPGREVYKAIKNLKVVISIGGNCSLKSDMGQIPDLLKVLRSMFIRSCIILIPPVHAKWLEKLSEMAGAPKSREQWIKEMDTIRTAQRSTWSPFVVDTYSPFLDHDTGEPDPLVLCDMVHFSKFTVDLVRKVLNAII